MFFTPPTGKIETLVAQHTLLATGGASGLYAFSTNPDTSTGDGIAMGWRAGCDVANLEFIQFHPTCLHLPGSAPFLISEALRGEGAILRLPDGATFMDRYDPRRELAPRDIVARAIFSEMTTHGLDHVLLDISHQPAEFIRSHFPIIHQHCLGEGLDITREPIPVAPAAHYTCGGIVTDECGRTSVQGLFAIGECGFTGLHGANRLASNSLLEGLVYASQASDTLLELPPVKLKHPVQPWQGPGGVAENNPQAERVRLALQKIMGRYAGIVRNDAGLKEGYQRLSALGAQVRHIDNGSNVARNTIELRNLFQVAELVLRSALDRRESRGAHFNEDVPGTLPLPVDSVLKAPVRLLTRAA